MQVLNGSTPRHVQETATPGLRPTEERDMPQVHELVNKYLSRFKVAPKMTLEEATHWLLPREGVIYSFVVEVGRFGGCGALVYPTLPPLTQSLCGPCAARPRARLRTLSASIRCRARS